MDAEDLDMSHSLAKISTPNLVPWIPPGKPKESTFNKYAHKKNKGVYDLGSSVATERGFRKISYKKSINYKDADPKKPKRSIESLGGLHKKSVSIYRQERIDDLLNGSQSSQIERDYLRKKILDILQESDEDKEVDKENNKRKARSRKRGLQRRNSDPAKKKVDKSPRKHRKSSYDGDEFSEPYSPEDESSKDRKKRSNKIRDEGYNSDTNRKTQRDRKGGKYKKPDSNPNGYQNQAGQFSTQNIPTIQYPVEMYPGGPPNMFPGEVYPGGQYNVGQGYGYPYQGTNYSGQNYPYQFQSNFGNISTLPIPGAVTQGFLTPLNNGYIGYGNQLNTIGNPRTSEFGGNFESGDPFFLSPTPAGFQSIQLSKSSNSKDAWLILPKESESPRGSIPNVRAYTAKKVNLDSTLGGKLKTTFAQVSSSSSPFVANSESKDPLVDDKLQKDKFDPEAKKMKALMAGGSICCILLILSSIIVLAVIFGSTAGSSNASLESQGLYLGPGSENDTRPCQIYEPLSESWRKIVGYGPINSGLGYHCDLPQYYQGFHGIREGWYRFTGDAGTHMATSSPGAYSPEPGTLKEVCGTSYVGWMNGQHPTLREGIVKRNFCFEWVSGSCQYGFESYVRTCPETNGDPSATFYVYFLKIPRDIQCNFAFCALS